MARLLIVQLALASLVTGAFLSLRGVDEAKAAAFGGLIASSNLLLMWWRARRAEKTAYADASRSLRLLYLSALERFFTVAFLFALGMGPMGLNPLPVVMGFLSGFPALISFNRIKSV